MESKKVDRRISRSRRELRKALLELILEKGYESVTIEEITNHADLGRATFYLHYKDKEDLLLESINEMIDDLVSRISKIPLTAWSLQDKLRGDDKSASTPILLIFQHAAEYANLYRVILRGTGSSEVITRLRLIIIQAIDKFIEVKEARENLKLQLRIPLEFFSNYFAGSLLGIVTWWLETNPPYSPEEMTTMFQQMFLLGAFHTLGAAPTSKTNR